MLEQKQPGLYTVIWHPIGGQPRPETLASLGELMQSIDGTELRLAPDETAYIINLTGAEAEKILEAEETIQATVDQFIANVCEEKIGKIVIPEKKSTWSDEVTYKPLSEYVGERFELLRKRDMTGTAALQVIPVTGNYPPPVCSRVSIWKRNLERRLKS